MVLMTPENCLVAADLRMDWRVSRALAAGLALFCVWGRVFSEV